MIRGQNDDLQSQTINWLRFPLAVAVVFIHSFGIPSEYALPSLNISSFSGMDFFNLIRICFSHVITHVAVPIFYLISGYLFFFRLKDFDFRRGYLEKIKSRLHTLVIPYILWNLISILSIVALQVGTFFLKGEPLSNIFNYFQKNGWFHLFWDCNIWGEDQLNWIGLATPGTGPSDLPLWFLRDLIVVVLITPILYWLIKHWRHYFIWILGFCYISGIWPNIPGLRITAVFFFCIGAYFSISRKNLVEEFKRAKLSSYILGMLFMIATVWYDGKSTTIGNFIYPFWIITGVCIIFNLAVSFVKSGRLKVCFLLSKSSFFIFATHTILVLPFCTVVCTKVLSWNNPLVLTIRYFIVPFLAVGICLLLFYLMEKYTPKLLGVLTGNR